jgi:signal transduction histidine kinase
VVAFLGYLPRGESLSDSEFKTRHTFLQWVLALHLPALLAFGLFRGFSLNDCLEAIAGPAVFLILSRMLRSRRLAGLAVTAGLSSCSASLVVLSGGAIEAHFHFFVTIGLIALYQDWVPFLWNALFTVFSHGVGSFLLPSAFFEHASGQHHPWTWSLIHGVAVFAACAGVMVQMRFVEDDHRRAVSMRAELADGNRKRFTADLLVNLARRNQNLIYRQLELLNRLEDHERDAEQLSHLFQLDHLATRIRRNAESLLVLSGEEPARKWGGSVLLVDVVRAAIAEIEELDRVDFSVDESLAVSGRAVADATHLLAELIENAVHFSPPGLSVMIRTRPYLPSPGAHVLTIEDWGVGMSPAEMFSDAEDLHRAPVGAGVASRPGGYDAAGSNGHGPAAGYGANGHGGTGLLDAPRNGSGADGRKLNGLNGNGSGRKGSGSTAAGRNGTGPDDPAHPGAGSTPAGCNDTGLHGGPIGPGPGSGFAGSGLNGTGSTAAGLDGTGLNGTGLNGTGLNGTGLNGTGLNGTGPHGGSTGGGPGGSGLPSRGARGSGFGVNGSAVGGATVGGTSLGGRRGPADAGTADPEIGTGVGYFGHAGNTPNGPLPAPRADVPAPAADPTTAGRSGRANSWSDWWPLPADTDGPGRPLGAPDVLAGGPGGSLTRRTPQANLADELRRGDQAAPEPTVRPRRDPAETRSALSRFQATQRAAREGREPGGDGKGAR